jgi:hypothetical protein
MAEWRCWCPEDENEIDARSVSADNPNTAARKYAMEIHDSVGDDVDLLVCVRDESGAVTAWSVSVETRTECRSCAAPVPKGVKP